MVFCKNKIIILCLLMVFISACSSDNEHFCARYQYLYEQLNDKDLLPYAELKPLLLKDIQEKGSAGKRSKMMLLALDDYHLEIIPEGELPKDYCMRSKRWKQ